MMDTKFLTKWEERQKRKHKRQKRPKRQKEQKRQERPKRQKEKKDRKDRTIFDQIEGKNRRENFLELICEEMSTSE